VRRLLETHAILTASGRARVLLDDWEAAGSAFWRIAPRGKLSRVERSERGMQAAV
jgi:glutamate synthase domain-containing protein 3